MKPEIKIRNVALRDADRVAAIYDFHARNGTASFETEGLTTAETRAKIHRIVDKGWPFLVAEMDGAVVGYAYATQFRDRPAYAFACENSIYVDVEQRGRGVGKALLEVLCAQAETFGFRQMLAVIGGGEEASVRVHASCAFEHAGRMKAVGWKKGRWLDTVYMQKALGFGSSEPAPQGTS
jgi:phosphinothricin acetyltransferase